MITQSPTLKASSLAGQPEIKSLAHGAARHAREGDAKTVLLVDDQPVMRRVVADLLRRLNHQVLVAEDAADAWRQAAAPANIDLLITDFKMPEVNGLDLAVGFRINYPNTPVLLISGSMPEIDSDACAANQIALLPKPFSAEQLLDAVRQLLSDRPNLYPTDLSSNTVNCQ